jgi:radical SAM family RiPP maturation amino acid epimerase
MSDRLPNFFSAKDIYGDRSEAELDRLAQIKRFTEYLVGDAAFRAEIKANQSDITPVLKAYGLDLDPELMRPLFDRAYAEHRFDKADERWPDAKLWDGFIADKLRHRDSLRDIGSGEANPRFAVWRARQVRRCVSELGGQSEAIVHALASYELSSGCSVGCWFCGISAERFGGHFPYTPENGRLWRGILGAMVDRFGGAARSGFCYWATDPCDNPDYLAFIDAHHQITGLLPQTTTAAPLKDVDLTRRILSLSELRASTINRFSILTTPILRRVFAAFTARELLGVEMVMQQKDSPFPKARAGRAINKAREDDGAPEVSTTIACVTGFLINMPERKVRLVSPTRASERWPDGYRVFDEGVFDTVEDFGALIDAMVDRNMAEEFSSGDLVRFRSNLDIQPTGDGFVAQTPVRRQTYAHPVFGRQLGELLGGGACTFGEIVERLGGQNAALLDIHNELQDLLDRGLLDDPSKRLMSEIAAE